MNKELPAHFHESAVFIRLCVFGRGEKFRIKLFVCFEIREAIFCDFGKKKKVLLFAESTLEN